MSFPWPRLPLKRLLRPASPGAVAIKGSLIELADHEGYPAYSASGQDVRVEQAQFSTEGIVLSAVGAQCGKCFHALGSWSVVANTYPFLPTERANARFMFYVVNQPNFWEIGGSAQPYVQVPRTLPKPIPAPSLDTQKRIAAFLDEKTAQIDALIEKKQALLERLAEKRQAIITQAVTKGLNPAAPMKPSGIDWLGEIPAHWQVKRLRYISPKQSVGMVVNPSNYIDETGKRPFIYGANIREFEIDWQSARRLTDELKPELKKSELHEGDVLVVRVGEPGVAAVVDAQGEGSNCASVMFVRKGNFCSNWLAYVMNSTAGRSEVSRVAYGAAQKQFNIEHAFYFRYPTPPTEEQEAIAARLDTVRCEIRILVDKVGENIEKLTEYRSALITAAVTGQIVGLQ